MILKPPSPIRIPDDCFSIFLAGSIELGVAVDWQTEFGNALDSPKCVVLNPRRDEWDASWEQSIETPQFRGQVEWELEAQERADLIVMNFISETKSPITLLELGLFAKTGKLVVHCPDGFWRKGNVDIVCARYNVPQVHTSQALIEAGIRKRNENHLANR